MRIMRRTIKELHERGRRGLADREVPDVQLSLLSTGDHLLGVPAPPLAVQSHRQRPTRSRRHVAVLLELELLEYKGREALFLELLAVLRRELRHREGRPPNVTCLAHRPRPTAQPSDETHANTPAR